MMSINDNERLRPVQILITACTTYDQPDPRCSWLHGYCVLTCQFVDDTVLLTGEVRTGERYSDDRPLIDDLTTALDPQAVLAGLDLTDMISRLGRLPIDAADQGPSLALLATLKRMLEGRPPLELTLTELSQAAVTRQVVQHQLCVRERLDCQGHDDLGVQLFGSHDNCNPNRLAIEMADTAGAVLLAIGDLHMHASLRLPLLAAWQRWRTGINAKLPGARAEGEVNLTD